MPHSHIDTSSHLPIIGDSSVDASCLPAAPVQSVNSPGPDHLKEQQPCILCDNFESWSHKLVEDMRLNLEAVTREGLLNYAKDNSRYFRIPPSDHTPTNSLIDKVNRAYVYHDAFPDSVMLLIDDFQAVRNLLRIIDANITATPGDHDTKLSTLNDLLAIAAILSQARSVSRPLPDSIHTARNGLYQRLKPLIYKA